MESKMLKTQITTDIQHYDNLLLLSRCHYFVISVSVVLVSLLLVQVVEGGEEVATRTTAVIGIQGEAGAALPVASETMSEVLAAGPKVPLVAVRPRMEAAASVAAVNQVPPTATAVLAAAAATDRVTLALQVTRLVLLGTRASRGRLSTGACPGPPPTVSVTRPSLSAPSHTHRLSSLRLLHQWCPTPCHHRSHNRLFVNNLNPDTTIIILILPHHY